MPLGGDGRKILTHVLENNLAVEPDAPCRKSKRRDFAGIHPLLNGSWRDAKQIGDLPLVQKFVAVDIAVRNWCFRRFKRLPVVPFAFPCAHVRTETQRSEECPGHSCGLFNRLFVLTSGRSIAIGV